MPLISNKYWNYHRCKWSIYLPICLRMFANMWQIIVSFEVKLFFKNHNRLKQSIKSVYSLYDILIIIMCKCDRFSNLNHVSQFSGQQSKLFFVRILKILYMCKSQNKYSLIFTERVKSEAKRHHNMFHLM